MDRTRWSIIGTNSLDFLGEFIKKIKGEGEEKSGNHEYNNFLLSIFFHASDNSSSR
jgi:hypothetical protein